MVGLLLVAPGLGACSFTSPTLVETFPASDGVNGEIPDVTTDGSVKLRNILLVTAAEGAPGALVGAVVNDTPAPVDVSFRVLGGDGQDVGGGKVTAAPGEFTQIGSGGAEIRVDAVPAQPGSTLQVQVETPAGGQRLTLPVLAATGPYEGEVPSEAPSPSPSPSATPSPSLS